jgi:hypothetical protein
LILKITATDQDGNKNDDEACGVTLSAFHAGRMQCATRSTCAKSAAGQNEPGTFTEYGALCKDQAARRYNSDVQKIDVTGFERFQGSYELRAIRRVKRALSARLMRTASFYTSPCASLLA